MHEDEDGNIVYTGSAPTVKTSQMLQVREALVQKIVCMDKDGWKRLGLGELQTCIFDIVDEKIYGSDKMADVPSSMARGTNGSLRPCFVAKTKSCSCKAEVERRTGESKYDDECGLCSGMGGASTMTESTCRNSSWMLRGKRWRWPMPTASTTPRRRRTCFA